VTNITIFFLSVCYYSFSN